MVTTAEEAVAADSPASGQSEVVANETVAEQDNSVAEAVTEATLTPSPSPGGRGEPEQEEGATLGSPRVRSSLQKLSPSCQLSLSRRHQANLFIRANLRPPLSLGRGAEGEGALSGEPVERAIEHLFGRASGPVPCRGRPRSSTVL